jgi:O-antigen/teichoic acid export membrane protein
MPERPEQPVSEFGDSDLKQRTVTGVLWSGGASVTQQILNFAVTVVLARLLVPADFGLVATIAIFTGFISLFVDFGISAALIQRPSLTERHRSSAFWMNLVGGILLGGLVAALAPLLARFFNEPRLVALTLVLSVNFVVGSLGIVQSALLQRTMAFRRLGTIAVNSTAIGGAAAIASAVAGVGVWSLIMQLIASTGSRTVLLWATSEWRPTRVVDRTAMRELWRYSRGLAGFNAVNYWARNADNFLIGKFVGPAGLGIYNRAYNLMLLPIQQISAVTSRVMFPALSRIHDDPARVRGAYLKAIGIIGLISFPFMLGLFVVAKPFILTLYGPKWAAAAPVLQILCIAGLMQPVYTTVGWIYQSQARTDLMMRWGLVASAVIVAGFALGIHWGVEGVAIGYAIAMWSLLYFGFLLMGRLIDMRVRQVFSAVRGALLCAIAMAAVMWIAGRLLPIGLPPVVMLLSQSGVGVLVYLFLIHSFVVGSYLELRTLLLERRGSAARVAGMGANG